MEGSDPFLIMSEFRKNYKKIIKKIPKNVVQMIVNIKNAVFHSKIKKDYNFITIRREIYTIPCTKDSSIKVSRVFKLTMGYGTFTNFKSKDILFDNKNLTEKKTQEKFP